MSQTTDVYVNNVLCCPMSASLSVYNIPAIVEAMMVMSRPTVGFLASTPSLFFC